MQETQALNLLDIPRSTFKEWSNPSHKKHKLYLLLKHIDATYAESCIVQKAPKHIMIILNRNIKQEERFGDNEIFKLFSKKSYAKLTSREKVAFAKIVRECEESDIQELFDAKVVSKEGFIHLLSASPLALFSPFGSNQTIIGLTMKKNLDYYMNLDYEIIVKKVKPQDGGGWFAYYKAFKGVMGDGESADEALQSVQESFKAFVTVALKNKEAIAEPKL